MVSGGPQFDTPVLGHEHKTTRRRLLIDVSKISFKAELLHNGNKFLYIPVAYATNVKETYGYTFGKNSIWHILLGHICCDLKIVALSTFFFFFCSLNWKLLYQKKNGHRMSHSCLEICRAISICQLWKYYSTSSSYRLMTFYKFLRHVLGFIIWWENLSTETEDLLNQVVYSAWNLLNCIIKTF